MNVTTEQIIKVKLSCVYKRNIYIYIYICVCVCVYMCVCTVIPRLTSDPANEFFG